MPVYNFKRIGPVPEAMELVDIVLMRTQRKTPTVVHPGYKISRIRSFYIRKIKFTQETITERLAAILTDFPRLNDIHPFYADLCNTLYDRDHYKLALGQLNAARGLVESISRDMIRMVKYGDSLYRCKSLKRAALGRMCTVLKRQKAALSYLEEVRKHLSRLPALDPTTRTLLLCGLPNVGKSSFMNKITRGNVEVQPYAFTTKSLFVGHTDYKYLRWQVIDTPGILDHSLEERNTIEMQSVIALAHLQCSVLYFVDISEQCGYPLEQQCSLFRSIQPLFANKQLIVVVNKIDQQPWEDLEPAKKNLVESLVNLASSGQAACSTTLLTMSNISEEGVSRVKATACEKLLESRVDARVAGNKVDSVLNRLQVFQPTKRDNVVREVCIPQVVLDQQERERHEPPLAPEDQVFADKTKKRTSRLGYAPTVHDDDLDEDEDEDDTIMMDGNNKPKPKKTARDRMWENGGPGVWSMDDRELYDLKKDEWRFDAIPEIMNGRNIADYMDADIEAKLSQLEKEEEQLLEEYEAGRMEGDQESDLDSEEEAAVYAIRDKKKTIRLHKRTNQSENKSMVPREIRGRPKDKHDKGTRNASEIQKRMDTLGVDVSEMLERGRSRERKERGRKRERSQGRGDDDDEVVMMDTSVSKGEQKRTQKAQQQDRQREQSVTRGHNKKQKTWTPQKVGLNPETLSVAKKLERKGRKGWMGGAGEGDNRKAEHLIQWMNTGKKRNGTHYCR